MMLRKRSIVVTQVLPLLLISFLTVQLLTANDTDRWEKDIAGFVEADKLTPPADGVVIFTGSSSIRRWERLAEDMSPLAVLNRGFGGSEISDLVRYADKLITCHKPSALVVFCGGNDINRGKTPEIVAEDFSRLIRIVRIALPEVPVFYISIRPTLKQWEARKSHIATNQLIKEYCEQTAGVIFIDIWDQFLGPATGTPVPEYFVEDRVHMNRAGYQLWSGIIRPLLVDNIEDTGSL